MLNTVTLMGRMVADAEVRQTNNGIAVASFRIAVERDTKSQDGQRQSDFINIVAWRQSAEFVSKYFHKGNMIALTGRIQTREYQDKDGNRRTAFEVVADRISFTGEKSGAQQNSGYAPDVSQNAPRSDFGGQGNNGYQRSANASQNAPQRARQTSRQEQWQELNEDDGELPF